MLLGRSPRAIVHRGAGDRGAAIEALTFPPAFRQACLRICLSAVRICAKRRKQLIAANARIGQAKAAYFPSISLTALAGESKALRCPIFSAHTSHLLADLGGSLAQTVFDAGRTSRR